MGIPLSRGQTKVQSCRDIFRPTLVVVVAEHDAFCPSRVPVLPLQVSAGTMVAGNTFSQAIPQAAGVEYAIVVDFLGAPPPPARVLGYGPVEPAMVILRATMCLAMTAG